MSIAIIDYGAGNLHSIYKKMEDLGANVFITDDAREIKKAEKIILPGVGHFGTAMKTLRQLNLLNEINELAIVKKKPFLGICLGMQLMAKDSEEGDSKGLGWIDAHVKRFAPKDKLSYKVPHIGWNTLEIARQSELMNGISESMEFYFTHSYHFEDTEPDSILNTTEYEYSFVSAIEKDNLFGVQYHPEKSHEAGKLLLSNFIKL